MTGQFLVHAGRPDDAIARLQTTIALDPNHMLARLFIATAYVEQEKYAEAIAESQVAVDRTHGRRLTHPLGVHGYALAMSGNVAQARAVLDELVTASQSRYVSPYAVAPVVNAVDERGRDVRVAGAWLRGARPQDEPAEGRSKWKNLHGDHGSIDLVKRIGTESMQ